MSHDSTDQSRIGRHRRRRFQTTALGFAVLGLALVGLCVLVGVVIHSAYQYVKDFVGPPETAAFFEKYITPVVMQDPKPFSDVSKLDHDWLLKTAIWATLTENGDSGKYAFTDDYREILPAVDVQKQFTKLFGKSMAAKFETFTDGNQKYEYNEKDKSFYIPVIALDNAYSPNVRSIARTKDGVKLTVDYIPGSGWKQNVKGSTTAPAASKTMLYYLKGSRGRYVLTSVENGPRVRTSSSSTASQQTGSGAPASSEASSSAATDSGSD